MDSSSGFVTDIDERRLKILRPNKRNFELDGYRKASGLKAQGWMTLGSGWMKEADQRNRKKIFDRINEDRLKVNRPVP